MSELGRRITGQMYLRAMYNQLRDTAQNMPEQRFSMTRIRENTGERKPAFWYVLRSVIF